MNPLLTSGSDICIMARMNSSNHRLLGLPAKYLSGPALYALATVVVLACFFELWRLALLIRQWDLAAAVPGVDLFKSFLIGLRFDLVIACYLTVVFYVLSIIPWLEITRRTWVRRVHLAFMTAVAAVIFFMHVIDLEFFSFFNSRLNGMALTWRDTPDMVLSMAWNMFPVIWYFLLILVVLLGFVWLMRRLQARLLMSQKEAPIWLHWVYLPLVAALLFVGARGRLADKSPIRTGVAYFSEYDFANQLALNPAFTFWRDAIYDARDKGRLEEMMATVQSSGGEPMVRRLLGLPDSLVHRSDEKILRPVRFAPPNDDPPNVILVVMESFGNTKLGALDNRFPHDLSPCFDSLAAEGILFTNFYSAGMHTYTGVFSTLTGYPHQFTELVMKQVPGHTHFHSLAAILKGHDYQTLFFTTHDPHFDNMQGFTMSNGVNRMYSSLDFDPDEWIGTWGVPDHILFDRAVEVLSQGKHDRFFAMLLSTSNHGPWQVPDVPFERIPEDVDRSDELNAFKYSDWALGRFVRQIQNDPAMSNTLIFITADNGTPFAPTLDLDLSYLQIPLLIIDTDHRLPAGRRIDRLGGQLDILATVMGQVRLDYDNYSFGHDLLDSLAPITDFAQFSEWFRVGYIEGDYYSIYRLRGEPGSCYRLDDLTVDLAKSEHELARPYLDKAAAMFKTAYENMSRPVRSAKLIGEVSR
ncbi:MAG: sulfatase-like hydrolase/transferase [candidate division Zixibacteria bacterium]|nr:sulfatase-like hydrolase/transferase [candidate division Zixibacteria bacterium]MDH3936370.1 sulfatase-like hydrolase/transferase [candidate division Zixibacteria bacterium]